MPDTVIPEDAQEAPTYVSVEKHAVLDLGGGHLPWAPDHNRPDAKPTQAKADPPRGKVRMFHLPRQNRGESLYVLKLFFMIFFFSVFLRLFFRFGSGNSSQNR